MRLFEKVLLGIVLASTLFVFAGCCCTGGLDDEDLTLNLPHDEGGGGTV
jgi:hypothetical protein